jgi:hypothetical protein
MLDHLGETEASSRIHKAAEATAAESGTTRELADSVIAKL